VANTLNVPGNGAVGSGDISIHCKMREEGTDLLLAHFARMAFAVKKNEAADPVDISLFGADAVALYAQIAAYSIEQLGLFRGGDGSFHQRR